MALAFDATSAGTIGFQSSETWSHTVSGSDRILIVGTCNGDDANAVSSITYNGTNLTKIRHDLNAAASIRTELWYLIAPDTGTNDVVVTWGSSAGDANGFAVSLTGADQSSPIRANNGDNEFSGTIDTSVTSEADDWVVDAIIGNSAGITVGADQTERQNIAGSFLDAGMSTEVATTTSTTMSWTHSSAFGCISAASVIPAANEADVTVSDSISTSESTGQSVSTPEIGASETVATTENVELAGVPNPAVSDSISVTDTPTMTDPVADLTIGSGSTIVEVE